MNLSERIRDFNLRHILLTEGSLDVIVGQIEAALVAHDKAIRQHQGALYLKTPEGLREATAELLRLRAMQAVGFYRYRKGNSEDVDPPLKYFTALLRKGTWGFPQLDATRKLPP
jgi:hypothetical protein